MHIGSIIPAYGRDYKSKAEAEQAWKDGQDFIIQNFFSPDDGRYVNIHEMKKTDTAELRYRKLERVTMVKGSQ